MPARRCHPSSEILPCSKEVFPGFEDATAPSPPPSYSLVLPNLETTYGRLRRTYILLWGFSKNELTRISGGLWSGRKNQISRCWLRFSVVVILGWCLNGSCRAQDALGQLLAAMLFLEGKGAAIPSPAQSRETFLLPLCWNNPSRGLKIGLRRWRGGTAQGKIGWSMFNEAALKCT